MSGVFPDDWKAAKVKLLYSINREIGMVFRTIDQYQ
jgi:hypothetical protein